MAVRVAEKFRVYKTGQIGRLSYSWMLGNDNVTAIDEAGVPVLQVGIDPFDLYNRGRAIELLAVRGGTIAEIKRFVAVCRVIANADSACMRALLDAMYDIVDGLKDTGLIPIHLFAQSLSATAYKQFRRTLTQYMVQSAVNAVCEDSNAHLSYLYRANSVVWPLAESVVDRLLVDGSCGEWTQQAVDIDSTAIKTGYGILRR